MSKFNVLMVKLYLHTCIVAVCIVSRILWWVCGCAVLSVGENTGCYTSQWPTHE
jgi:hypothetical protein